MKQTNKDILFKLIDEVWNKGNFDRLDDLISPNYVIRNDPGDACEFMTLDLSAFKQRVDKSRAVFPDLHFDIEDAIAEEDKVAISWFMTGTQQGDLPGLPATGKQIKVSGLTIYYFFEGKIIGHWQVFDRLGLMGQLGVQIGQNEK